MNLNEFQDLIDRWGQGISGWPDPQRQAAVDLVARSADARTLLEEAQMLRNLLSAPRLHAPAELVHRILGAATGSPRHASPRDLAAPVDSVTAQPG
jgi:hypothetical protein